MKTKKQKNANGLRQLTLKQKLFADTYIKQKGNRTKAIMKAYDVKNKDIAHTMASQEMAKPHVKQYIEQSLARAGYDPVNTIRSLMTTEGDSLQSKASRADGLKASELLLRLSGSILNKSQSVNLNMNMDNLDTVDLLQMKQKLDKLFSGK